MERNRFTVLQKRVSWGSIFAGTVTVLAISFLLSLLGSSIGLFMIDPLSDHPMSGVGTTVGIWTVVSLLISLAAGGFVAGKLAGADGMIHGFLTWATTLIVTVVLGAMLAISAVKTTVNILGSISSAAGSVISNVGSAVGDGVSSLADEAQNVFGDIDFDDMDKSEVKDNVRQALKKSGVKEFQPEYLDNQFKLIRSDLQKSVKKLVTHPNDADNIINDFTDRVKKRTETAFQDVNRDDLTKAIANNSSMSKAEVDKAVDEYIILYNNAREQGQERIADLEQTVADAKQQWEKMKQDAREKADKASNSAARSALWSFFGILIGGGLCAFTGFYGAKMTKELYEA